MTIAVPNSPVITNISTVDASCTPGNDGSITITASGGIAPYQYNNGGPNQPSNSILGVGVGSYIVTVTDAVGCTVSTAAVILNQPSPTIDSFNTTAASCNPGCDGGVSIFASGGTNPTYTYSVNASAFQSSNAFGSLCTGLYTAVVMDGNGCVDSAQFTISTANGPTINSLVADSVNCNGGSDGSISITASSVSPPMSYNLMPGNITNANGIFNNLPAANFIVTVTDGNGCLVSTNVVVNEPSPVQFDTVVGSGSSCNSSSNGTINVAAVGGTGLITFALNPAAIFTPPGTFSNLAGNTSYTVTATDANSCSITTSMFISAPAALVVNNVLITDVVCNGNNDGTAQISTTGGTSPFSFNLQPGNITNTTGNFSALFANTYTVTVTDANNCTVSTTIVINEPPVLQITNVSSTEVVCKGDSNGTIQINGVGGVAPLSFNLQPGSLTNTTGNFTNLTGLTYTITITDANNCTLTTQVIVNEPDSLLIDSMNVTMVSCAGLNDASISVNTSGGNGGNNYYLQPININNNTGQFANLSAQQYYITVVDTNGCIAWDSVLITEPTALTASHTHTNVSCNGGNDGTITAVANGGTPGYTYTLTPNNVTNNTGGFASLTAGFYTITVMDANNCSTTINGIEITEPTALQIDSFEKTDIACFGQNTGRISITATGGTPPLSYSLTPMAGLQPTPGQFIALMAGSYVVAVTDANGCLLTTNVTLIQNPQIVWDSILITTPLCHGDDNGFIEFTASGGVGNILYSFNNQPATTNNFQRNLVAGTYPLSAIDSIGCRLDTIITLTEPDPITISSFDITNLTCIGSKDGFVVINTIGGVGYYTFYIRPGIQFNRTGIFTNLDLGQYSVKIVDTNNCRFDSFFTINNNTNPLVAVIKKRNLSCLGFGNEGEAEVIIIGGEQPYNYTWSTDPVQQTAKVTGLRFGLYWVAITDAKGCQILDTVYIEPGPCCQELFLPTAFSPNGDGLNDVFRVITTAGVDLIQFDIYNRWGNLVWQTFKYNDEWNGIYQGADAVPGAYYYIYRYRCITDGKEYIRKGDITLIR